MAREIMLSDGRTALFDDDATDEDIEKQLKERKLTRATGPVAPQAPSETGGSSIGPYALSTINSLAFGIPEVVARQFGAGPAIEQMRQDYPIATTAGDITGLISPAKVGMKLAEKGLSYGMSALGRRGAREAEQAAIMSTMRASDAENAARTFTREPTLRQMAGTVGKKAVEYGGGLIGAQTGAGMLGGARSPDNYGGGFQQGAQVFGQTATNLPGTQLIPGAQTAIGAATSVVPNVAGYGDLAYQYALEQRMREEAARRALQGQQ